MTPHHNSATVPPSCWIKSSNQPLPQNPQVRTLIVPWDCRLNFAGLWATSNTLFISSTKPHKSMLMVKTYVGKSPIHGLGLFAAEPIEKDQEVSRFVPGFDSICEAALFATLPPSAQVFLRCYGFLWPCWRSSWDAPVRAPGRLGAGGRQHAVLQSLGHPKLIKHWTGAGTTRYFRE